MGFKPSHPAAKAAPNHTSGSAIPIATALRRSLRTYTFADLRHDLMAAFVVSLVALPLSMALAIAVGLPPQHGVYTAIVAGIVVPLIGGSTWQVSGPTAAFVVVLAPIASQHGLRGIVWAGLMAGVILIGMGFARLGRLINYVPYPVTTGFTAGIAVVLATLSLNDFLGLGIASLEGSFFEKLGLIGGGLAAFDPATALVGVSTLVLMFTGHRLVPVLPSAIVAVVFGTALALSLDGLGQEVATVGSRFSYMSADGSTVQGIPPNLPGFGLPTLAAGSLYTLPTLAEIRELLFPAVAIAILAALESLLSATVADSMAGTRHDPNAELTGIGVGNILSALAAGIPATGAIARTATAINNGARSPLASSMHAGLIAIYVLLLAPWISHVPMAVLSALLIHTAYRMSHHHQFVRILRIAPRSDVVVLLLCFTLTVFIDMVAGVGVGMIAAAFLVIKRLAELTRIEVENEPDEVDTGLQPRRPGTMVFRIRGPLFFGTVERAFDRSHFTFGSVEHVVLDLRDVPFIDMSGLVALRSTLDLLATADRSVDIVCDVDEVEDQIRRKIAGSPFRSFVHFRKT